MSGISLRDVEDVVCARFHMTREAMRGPCRLRKIARPRQIAMYLARTLTGKSYPAIGAWFRRDHTTVLYAERRIMALMAKNPKVRAHVEGLRAAVLATQTREAA